MGKKGRELVLEAGLGRLPAELMQFLSSETYSLLIKGGSGSGKTILALTILGSLKRSDNILYISTRTSPHQLLKHYPWIRKVFGVNQESRGEGPTESGLETLVDARLDEPGIVFERITNVLMDKRAPTVVIDSWEAMNDSLKDEALRTNIRVLETWRERAGARFIFVGEDAANTAIDSIVDGVVTLTELLYAGRRLREIFLSKLHGVQISRPTYFFSLENGVFHSFDRYHQSDNSLARPATSKKTGPGGDQRHYSTGFRPLDDELGGGYPSKSLAWVEADPRVDSRAILAFLAGTIREWAASGRRVVLQRSETINLASASQLKASQGGGDSGQVVVWGSNPRARAGTAESLAALRSSVAEGSTPVLSIMDWDKFTQSTAPVEPVALQRMIDFLKRYVDLSILVSRSGPAQSPFSRMVATHIKIVEINGTLFAMSEKPWSELYAIVPEESGNPGLRLERVV